jgi:hypothetical protein
VIRGYFEPADKDRQLAGLRVSLAMGDVPGAPSIISGEVPFVLDTGSETSCLHPHDAVLGLGIGEDRLRSPTGWRVQAERFGVGGRANYFLVPCVFTFTHEDGSLQNLEGVIEVAQLTDTSRFIPSILGWDVLKHFAIRLDWSQRAVELA